MKELKFNVNDDICDAFNTFCKEYNTTPEDAIENLINFQICYFEDNYV